MRQVEVNKSFSERFNKLASLPIQGFVCFYKLDDEIYTDAMALDKNELEELLHILEK